MTDFLRAVWAIARKDLRSELRTKEMFAAMVIFALLAAVIFSFAFNANTARLREVFPGLIWVAFFFAGTLGLNRSFVGERQNQALQGLMLAPADRSAIYYGKMLGNLIVMLTAEAIGLPVFFVLFDAPVEGSFLALVAALLMATLGFIAVGTFLAALAANTRTSEILLPILLFPVAVPVMLGAVQTTGAALQYVDWESSLIWFKILAAYDVVFLIVPLMLFDHVLEV